MPHTWIEHLSVRRYWDRLARVPSSHLALAFMQQLTDTLNKGEELTNTKRQMAHRWRLTADDQIAKLGRLQRRLASTKVRNATVARKLAVLRYFLSTEPQERTLCVEAIISEADGADVAALLGDAREAVVQAQQRWQRTLAGLTALGARPSMMAALLNPTRMAGVEAASVVVGALVIFGATYSYFLFATVGTAVTAFSTPEDLLIQGMRIAPVIVVLLIVLSSVFTALRRMTERTGTRHFTGWVFSFFYGHFVKVFLLLAFVATSVLGLADGLEVRRQALDPHWVSDTAVMEGNDLIHGVKLVGTTARTAVFLRAQNPKREQEQLHCSFPTQEANEPEPEPESESESESPTLSIAGDYFHVLGLMLNKLLAGRVFPGGADLHTAMCRPRGFDVLTLDRGHVTCLATGDVCEESTVVTAVPEVHSVVPIPDAQLDGFAEMAKKFFRCNPVQAELPERVFFPLARWDDRAMCTSPATDQCRGDAPEFPSPATALGQHQEGEFSVWVAGFASSDGDADRNLRLADRRAETVAAALSRAGWESVRVASVGETLIHQPGSDSPEARRAEILVCELGDAKAR